MTDGRNIRGGYRIPSELYSDQPYIVVADNGAWVCEVTTASGHEGAAGTHILIARSHDQGRTWSDPVCIEPDGQPESSYGVFLKTDDGRIYCFYDFNADNLRTIRTPTGNPNDRIDMQGHFVYRYSDDHGVTWSERWEIPIRETQYDRENPHGGKVRLMWNVGRPFLHRDDAYVPLSKIKDMLTVSEGWVLVCPGLNKQRDPDKHRWELRPEGDQGLRTPEGGGPIAEEQSIVPLSDGSLYCVYRSIDGQPVCTYSRDGGRTWEPPQYKRYDNGRRMYHNRAANFVWKCRNGKYLYWFNNRYSKDYPERNPIFLAGGVEENGRIRWTQPELILYDDDPQTIISYPDLIEDQGRYFISETQKVEARIHEIPVDLLEGLWGQFTNEACCDEGLLLDARPEGRDIPMPTLPELVARNVKNPAYGSLDLRAGFTLELELTGLPQNTVLLDSTDSRGRGIRVACTGEGTLHFSMSDGRTLCAWHSDALFDGPHHAVIRVDGGPKVISFIVDGILHDGDGKRQVGWGWYNPYLRDANGAETAAAAPCVARVRAYGRCLTTSQAVGNYRAYAKLPSRRDYIAADFPFGETACHLPVGDRTIEWQRTQPDLVVYLPKNDSYDNDNEHFLVFEAPSDGELLALWTQSSLEGKGDNHLVLARSRDGVRWSAPVYLAGAVAGGEALQASWGFPIVTQKGRLYVFYTKEEPSSEHKQHGGAMHYLYSDDSGHTFTQGKNIPMPRTPHDHPDPAVPKNWIVWQKPIRDSKGRFIAGYTLWSSTLTYQTRPNWMNQDSWTYFMRFENLEEHPEDIQITWLPKAGGIGVPNAVYPDQSACQEPATVLLPDGRLFAVMRTMTGHPYYVVSADDGETFSEPAPLTYEDGTPVDHPMSPCPLYRLDGDVYLLAYHDNPGVRHGISQFDKVWTGNHSDALRNPVYLLFGRFDPSAKQPIVFRREPVKIGDTDDIAVGPKRTAEVGTYPSVTRFQGRTVFWYPDRKFYLLGKYIDPYIERYGR